jgi:hypothetical protein
MRREPDGKLPRTMVTVGTMKGRSGWTRERWLRPKLLPWLLVAAVPVVIGCQGSISAPGSAGSDNGQTGTGQTGSGGAGNTSTGSGGTGKPTTGSGGSGQTGTGSGGSGTGQTGSGGTGSGQTGSGGTGTSTGSGGASTGSGGTGTTVVGNPPVDCDTAGPRLVRRLTASQLKNTLVAAFGGSNLPSTDILSDPNVMRFHVDADVPVVRDLDAGLLLDYAETVAAWAVQNKAFGGLSACSSTTDKNCEDNFIKGMWLKLAREPIGATDLKGYEDLYAAETTFNDAATAVLMTMLQSPYLLYRRELGTGSSSKGSQLTPYEVASELSYFLTDGPPDSTLMNAAAQAMTSNAALKVDDHAGRLLALPAADAALKTFVDGWLEIDGLRIKTKDNTVFNLTPELRDAMIQETEATFLDAFKNGGDVGKLLTTTQKFGNNSALTSFYSSSGGTRPAGVLGQAAFLAQHAQPENSSPVQRGRAIRERFLCATIPEVPKNLNTTLAPPGTFKTNRERFEMHSADAACVGCHKLFDPVGFVFENYDGFGRYRTTDNGNPVDATGSLKGMPGGDVPLNGPQSLIDYLSTSDQVRACVVRYMSYYAHGRDSWTGKQCNDDKVRIESAKNGNSLKSVLMGLLHAQTFSRRVQDQ